MRPSVHAELVNALNGMPGKCLGDICRLRVAQAEGVRVREGVDGASWDSASSAQSDGGMEHYR